VAARLPHRAQDMLKRVWMCLVFSQLFQLGLQTAYDFLQARLGRVRA